MTTEQQPHALFLADELLNGGWAPNVLQNESGLRESAATELRRLHGLNRVLMQANNSFALAQDRMRCELEDLRAGYDAARLEIASLNAQNKDLADSYHRTCRLVAEMHSAATGCVIGPKRGVVEDVADLRTAFDALHAQLEAVGAGGVTALMAAPAQKVATP